MSGFLFGAAIMYLLTGLLFVGSMSRDGVFDGEDPVSETLTAAFALFAWPFVLFVSDDQ